MNIAETLVDRLNETQSTDDKKALLAIRSANSLLKEHNLYWTMVITRATPLKPQPPSENREPGDFVFPFGKYSGMTVADVSVENRGYLEWCIDNLDSKRNGPLLAAIESVLDD